MGLCRFEVPLARVVLGYDDVSQRSGDVLARMSIMEATGERERSPKTGERGGRVE